MSVIQDLETKLAHAQTTPGKINALNALALELQNADTPRAKMLAESALHLIAESQDYNHEKAKALLVLGFGNFRLSNYEIAMQQSKDARVLFEQADDKKGIARSLNNMGLVYTDLADYPNALKYLQDSLSISKGIGNKDGTAASLNNIGNVYYALSDYPNALKHHQESLHISRESGNKHGIARSLNNIGLVYESLSDFSNALKHYQDSLNISRESGVIADSLDNIGSVYGSLADYPNALKYLQEGLSLKQTIGDKRGIANSLNQMGSVYRYLADYPNALKYFQDSLSISKSIGDKQGIANSLNNIGSVYEILTDYPNALQYVQDSLSISKGIGDKQGIANATLRIGSTLIKLRRLEEAETYLEQALALCDELGLKSERFKTLESLAQLYAETNRFKKAYFTHIEFHNANKSVFSEDNQKQLTTLQVRFETEQSQKEAELYRLKNIDLVEANRFKTELLSLAAHDLKSPLQAIMGFAQLIEESDEIPDHIEKKAAVIIDASKNMNRLIIDLLDTAAMEQGKLAVNKSRVFLAELAGNLVSQYQPQAAKKKQTIQFHAAELCEIETDRDKMQRVLENLVSNAIKYSPEGKAIWVSIEEINGTFEIAVRDEGLGITEADKEKLFQKFQRLSARPTGGENSTGLGLSIAKQLVELLGGSIRCESAGKNQGARFIVTLPSNVPILPL
jgi:signal transduction histidine kinase